MAKYEDGEYISLYGDIEYHYIKGYVSSDEAQVIIDRNLDDTKVKSVKHTFAFWGVGQDEMGEPSQIFYVRDSSGRGRFKVTEIDFCNK